MPAPRVEEGWLCSARIARVCGRALFVDFIEAIQKSSFRHFAKRQCGAPKTRARGPRRDRQRSGNLGRDDCANVLVPRSSGLALCRQAAVPTAPVALFRQGARRVVSNPRRINPRSVAPGRARAVKCVQRPHLLRRNGREETTAVRHVRGLGHGGLPARGKFLLYRTILIGSRSDAKNNARQDRSIRSKPVEG